MNFHSREIIIHLSWCVGVLTIITILFFSKDLSTVPDIKDIMSFALTFSSLLLAIIAIVQTTVSSNSSSTVLTSLVSVSGKVEQSTRELSELTNSMPKTFEQMHSAMSNITSKTEEIRLEMMKNQERAEPILTGTRDILGQSTPSGLDTIFLTNGQVLAIYLCIRAFDARLPFSPAAILQPTLSGEYQTAVISTMKILNACDVEEISNGFVVKNLGKIESYRDYIVVRAEDPRLQFFASAVPKIDLMLPRTKT